MHRPLLEGLLSLVEQSSLSNGDSVSLRKRLFNVLVEGLENIHVHTPAELAETGFALLVRRDGGYVLFFGNAMPVASATLLAHRVEMLNEMDEADLREHYLKLLANEGRTERGGAGLGLLTLARKSNRPLVVHSLPHGINSTYVALELQLA